jgi:hypothetical protein
MISWIVSIVHEKAAAAVGNNIAYTTPCCNKIRGDNNIPDQNPKHNEHLNSSSKKSFLIKDDLILLRIDPYFKI